MSDFLVTLFPLQLGSDVTNEVREYLFEGVDLGFNQLGWLVLTDAQRQPVAAFTPNVVQFIRRINDIESSGEVIETEATEIVVN